MENMNEINSSKEKKLENLHELSSAYKYIMEAVKRCRQLCGMTQGDLCKKIGISPGIYSQWDNEKNTIQFSNLFQLIKVCNELGVSINHIICMANDIIDEDKSASNSDLDKVRKVISAHADCSKKEIAFSQEKNDVVRSNMKRHFERLMVFSGKKYVALYRHFSTPKKTNISILHISTGEVDLQGYCPFEMYINGNPSVRYTGKIVSPPNNFYVYFYITGGDPIERGMWILYQPPFISENYVCGSGILLSIERNAQSPAFQRIVLIEETTYQKKWQVKEVKQFVMKLLDKQFPKHEYPFLLFSEIQADHKELYEKIFEEVDDWENPT